MRRGAALRQFRRSSARTFEPHRDHRLSRPQFGARGPRLDPPHPQYGRLADARRFASDYGRLAHVRRDEKFRWLNAIFSDRVRTSVNVLGDAYAASIVAHYLQDQLQANDANNNFVNEIREEIGQPHANKTDANCDRAYRHAQIGRR